MGKQDMVINDALHKIKINPESFVNDKYKKYEIKSSRILPLSLIQPILVS
jgi:urease alpha subunit